MNRESSFPKISQAQLGMYIGLASISMLFAASLVGYFVTRAQAKAWRAVDLPEMPLGLWGSTLILVLLSGALHYGLRQVRANKTLGLTRSLFGALLLGVLFCASQFWNWQQVAHATLNSNVKGLYIYTFFMLTALHALHVVAGIAPLWWVHKKSNEGQYSSSRFEGVRLVTQYWDYLLVVWMILLAALHLA